MPFVATLMALTTVHANRDLLATEETAAKVRLLSVIVFVNFIIISIRILYGSLSPRLRPTKIVHNFLWEVSYRWSGDQWKRNAYISSVHLRGESILWRGKQLKMSFRQDFCTDDLRGDQRWSPLHHKDHRQFRRLVIARSKKNRESDISQKVFELVKLNNEFENCLNPENANKFVILNHFELKFLHSANTG